MTDFRRLFLSIFIAFLLIFSTPNAHSSPLFTAQNTSSEFLNLGIEQMRNGGYNKAIDNFNQAIQLQQNLPVAYNDRCLAYLQLQDYHQAIADCTQAINLATDNVEPYLNRGLAHYRQGNYPAAIVNYNQAIALRPDDFRAYYNRGLAHTGEGNYLEAITNYNLALTQIPQTTSLPLANIYNDRGLVRFELQDFAAAVLDFDIAIRLNPQDDRAYFNRACTCGRNGDDFGAIRDFSQVIRLNASNAQAYVNRGVASYRLGYHQKAIADLQTASKYFGHQGNQVAYQKTLDLLKSLRQQIQLATEIA
ncbi:tetratricopeptide repeat protein [Halotia branconii]|uniref:Tetratricopeptide repeat protein n=1 Tax=Halotia branconii CENA392 TaxID=1539056 RepID=A0AAJ6NNJ8_9CYAN|nr:tetratricopeptide repeat protein [Halotia branconii]WGV23523.1 tetratricopeptide repeat protein [Halotia branconii CENA392]